MKWKSLQKSLLRYMLNCGNRVSTPSRHQDEGKQHISGRIKGPTPDPLGKWEHGVGREPDNKLWAATVLSWLVSQPSHPHRQRLGAFSSSLRLQGSRSDGETSEHHHPGWKGLGKGARFSP